MKFIKIFFTLFGGAVLITALVSWFSSDAWGQRPYGFFEMLAAVITGIAAFMAGVTDAVSKMFAARKASYEVVKLEQEANQPFEIVTVEQFVENLGEPGKISWVRRKDVPTGLLRKHQHIIFVGEIRAGKTRAALELIRAGIQGGLITEGHLLRQGRTALSADPTDMKMWCKQQGLENGRAALFIDDLPRLFESKNLGSLDAMLAAVKDSKAGYLIATARTEQLEAAHQDWLAKHRFEVVELKGLTPGEREKMIYAASGLYGVSVTPEALKVLTKVPDCPPEYYVIVMERLKEQNITTLGVEDAEEIAKSSLEELWGMARREAEDHHPANPAIIQSLAICHGAKVPVFTKLVTALAADLYGMDLPWWQQWGAIGMVSAGLDSLNRWRVLRVDDWVELPRTLVDGLYDDERAKERLVAFLQRASERKTAGMVRFSRKDQALTWFYLGVRENEPEQKIDFYTIAIECDPGDVNAFINRGNVYADLRQYEKAIADFTAALQHEPDLVRAYNNRGLTYAEWGQPEKAIADYTAAVERDPNYLPAYYNRGLLHARTNRPEQALADYSAALERDPDYLAAYITRGGVYASLDQYGKAIADYSAALQRDENYLYAYLHRGNVHAAVGHYKQAIADFNAILARDPERTQAYNNRGNVYTAAGQFRKAVEDYTAALERQPDVMAYTNRAYAYCLLGEIDRAQADVAQAAALAPAHPFTTLAQGYLAFYRGQYREALDILAGLEPTSGDRTPGFFDKALPLLCLGEKDEAMKRIEERLAEHPCPDDTTAVLPHFKRLHENQPDLDGAAQTIAHLEARIQACQRK